MILGFREFEFDLPDALLKSMIRAFDSMESAPLIPQDVSAIPDAQGVYLLLLDGKIVYVGKTDSEAGLQNRLSRHAWTIQHRRDLSPHQVSFKAVRVYVFTAMDLEAQLIRHYTRSSGLGWNNSGFGSNDPGRNRDFTRAKPNSFDSLYPLDLDQPIVLGLTGQQPLRVVLSALQKALPYTFRVEGTGTKGRSAHTDFDDILITVPSEPTTARNMAEKFVAALPPGWQATALAGRIVMYREHRDDYPENRVIARR